MNHESKTIFSKTNPLWNLKLFLNKRLKRFIIIWRFFSISILSFFLFKLFRNKSSQIFFERLFKTKVKSNFAYSISISSFYIFAFLLISYLWLRFTEIIPNFAKSINLNSSQFEDIFKKEFFLINGKKFNVVKFDSVSFFIRDGSNLIDVKGKFFLNSENEKECLEFLFNSNLHTNSLSYFLEIISKKDLFKGSTIKFKRSNVLSLFSVKGIIIAFISINLLIISYNLGKKTISYLELQSAIQEDKIKRWSPIKLEDLHSFDKDIAGYEQVISDLSSSARSFSKGRGLVLYGPPGTGKTLLAECYAKASKFPYMFCATGDDLKSSILSDITGVSSSEGKITEFLDWVLKNSNEEHCLVFIDEIDKMGSSRGSEFLDIIGGLYDWKYKKIFFIVTTNNINWFVEGCTRSGRFEHKYNIDYPDHESSYKIINFYFDYFKENCSKFNMKFTDNLTSNKFKIINFIYYSINGLNVDDIPIVKTVEFLRKIEGYSEKMILKIVNDETNVLKVFYENYNKNNCKSQVHCESKDPDFENNQFENNQYDISKMLDIISKKKSKSSFTGADIKSLMLSFFEIFIYWEAKIGENKNLHLAWKLEFFNILEKRIESSSDNI